MSLRPIVLLLGLLTSGLVFAQADDWSTFPPTSPPKAAPAPAPPAPAPTPPAPDSFAPTPFPSRTPAAPTPAAPTPPTPTPPAPDSFAPTPFPSRIPPAPTPPASSTPPIPPRQPPSTPAPPATLTPAPPATTGTGTATTATTAPAAAPGADESGEGRVISTQERFIAGSEPHSPSTLGHAINDPLNTRQSAAAFGGIGLLHLSSADLGRTGLFRFSAEGEYFGASNFPVPGAEDVHSAGTFSISYVPLEFLEAYVGYSVAANSNSTSSPSLIQTIGDLTFGAKAARKWAPGLYAGGDLRLQSFSGVGNQDVRRFAFALDPQAIATFDAREPWSLPLRAHANLGFALDGSGGLVRQHTLTSAEEFALGVNRYSRFTFGIGLEVPLPVAMPFIEYNVGVPLGVPRGVLLTPDRTPIPLGRALPARLGLGARITALRDVTFLAALDIGLTSRVALGIPATPKLNLLFGVSFAVDPFQREKTRLVEQVREREHKVPEPPKAAKVAGVVVDAQSKKPVPGVIIAMAGAGLPPVATDSQSGRFLTQDLPSAGHAKLTAQKDGYKPVEQEVELELGKTTNVELAMQAQAQKASFAFTVTSQKKPVAATVGIKGQQDQPAQQVPIPDSAKEPVKVEVAPGHYTVTVSGKGYLAQTHEAVLPNGGELALAFDLVPEPKEKLVAVKQNKIVIYQQVHFATNRAIILPDSFPLLAQVVDAIVKNDIQRIRIEGHADTTGSSAGNLQLSQDRARAVGDYLIKQGVDPSRIETVGYGDTRPLAPNLTARGRELNRRVEFLILKR